MFYVIKQNTSYQFYSTKNINNELGKLKLSIKFSEGKEKKIDNILNFTLLHTYIFNN